jgi:hypothetical protein
MHRQGRRIGAAVLACAGVALALWALGGALAAAGTASGTGAARGEYGEPLPDLDPPQTLIAKTPGRAQLRKRRAPSGLTSDEPGSSFECALDGAPFSPCAATLILPVKRGRHVFLARAIDSAANADPTPAEHRFKAPKRSPRR